MADIEKQRLAALTGELVTGILATFHADALDEDIEFLAAFYTPECAADARQILNATSEYLCG